MKVACPEPSWKLRISQAHSGRRRRREVLLTSVSWLNRGSESSTVPVIQGLGVKDSEKQHKPTISRGMGSKRTNKPVSESSAEVKPPADWLIATPLADLLTFIAHKLLIC